MFGAYAFATMYFAEGPGGTPTPPTPGVANVDKFTLGTKESLSVTVQPTIGGSWSW